MANCGVAARREFILLSHVGATLRKDRGCAHPARLPPHLKSLLLVISLFLSLHRVEPIVSFLFSPPNMKILPHKKKAGSDDETEVYLDVEIRECVGALSLSTPPCMAE